MIDHFIKKYVKLIDFEKTHIIQFPPIVFLCGGEIYKEEKTNHSIRNMFMSFVRKKEKKTNHSIRNMFMNIVRKSEFEALALSIKLAEDFKNWHIGYDNLSEFENDIASLSSYIVIILESAGSIAELGLFYANHNLKSKLIVIIREEHYNSNSFIKLGLIQPLKCVKNDSVYVYKLASKDIEKITVTEIREIVGDVHDFVKNVPRISKFNKSDRGHVLYLIFQLIDLFHALKKTEIEECLLCLEISNMELNSGLYILESLSFIRCVRKSNIDFYITQIDATDRLKFGYKPQFNSDGEQIHVKDAEIKIEYMTFITTDKSTLNRRRKNAIVSKELEA